MAALSWTDLGQVWTDGGRGKDNFADWPMLRQKQQRTNDPCEICDFYCPICGGKSARVPGAVIRVTVGFRGATTVTSRAK